ncbi:MAG: VOC family protein [Actinomycetota bacterium]|nr:VOC family protein [Actinomycetota bacterium]
MGKRESYEPGTFCWVELSTTDAEGAKAFYGDLLGWEFRDDEIPGGVYTMCLREGDAVAAIFQQDGFSAHWNNYVSVTSADETAAKAKQLGARIIEEPFDVMEFGRMAVLADPGGAMLCVWEARAHIGAGRVNDVGCMSWNELQTRDSEAAGDFYGGLFGWEIEPIEDDGALVYTTVKNAGVQNGGFMPMAEQHGDWPSFWLPYFTVSSRDGAIGRTKELGGALVAGPLDLPAGKIAILADPQDAPFAVFEGQTDE